VTTRPGNSLTVDRCTKRWRFDRMATVCHPDSGRITASFAAVAKHYGVGWTSARPGMATARAWWRRATFPRAALVAHPARRFVPGAGAGALGRVLHRAPATRAAGCATVCAQRSVSWPRPSRCTRYRSWPIRSRSRSPGWCPRRLWSPSAATSTRSGPGLAGAAVTCGTGSASPPWTSSPPAGGCWPGTTEPDGAGVIARQDEHVDPLKTNETSILRLSDLGRGRAFSPDAGLAPACRYLPAQGSDLLRHDPTHSSRHEPKIANRSYAGGALDLGEFTYP
jgi:hypothetical protein